MVELQEQRIGKEKQLREMKTDVRRTDEIHRKNERTLWRVVLSVRPLGIT